MLSKIGRAAKAAVAYSAVVLARFGVIDEERGKRIVDIAWPRVIYGVARRSKFTVDLAMVGLVVGPAAIAGLGFAYAIWGAANAIGWSFANGAMAFFSQRYGAGDQRGLDQAVGQTLWILLVTGLAFTILLVAFAESLIALLGAEPEALRHGTLYLQVVAVALVLNFLAQIASRLLVSANDAWTPMVVRGLGAVANVILNAIFIFGLGLGVFGAALGTVIAALGIAVALTYGMVVGRLPGLGNLPVMVNVSAMSVDPGLAWRILVVAVPVAAQEIVSRGANIVMLAIIAYFGTIFVAAYAVAREIRDLMHTPSWGIGTAARSLIGQELGRGDEAEAEAYGWDIIRFTLVIYIFMSVLMFAFADRIAPLFTDDPNTILVAIPFIMVMAISLLGLGSDYAISGILGAAGDTRWPLYGRLIGLYGFMLPIAALGVLTPLGVVALYVALLAETIVPALITYYRYITGHWKRVSRRIREG